MISLFLIVNAVVIVIVDVYRRVIFIVIAIVIYGYRCHLKVRSRYLRDFR